MRSRAIQVTLLLALVLVTSARGIADDNGPRGLPASLPHISTEAYQEQLSHSRELWNRVALTPIFAMPKM